MKLTAPNTLTYPDKIITQIAKRTGISKATVHRWSKSDGTRLSEHHPELLKAYLDIMEPALEQEARLRAMYEKVKKGDK